MASNTEQHETMKSLISSKRWDEVTSKLDIMELGRIGPIDWSGVSKDAHIAVRKWARGSCNDMPPIIREYLAKLTSQGDDQ